MTEEDKEIDAFVVLIHLRDLLKSIDGNIDTAYLWRWIENECKENRKLEK